MFIVLLSSRRLCPTRATPADGGGVIQNPCYDAVMNALFLFVYLQLPDSWNIGRGRGVFNNAVNCKDYVTLVLDE